MKITCLDKQVGKLFSESFYTIPRFQRPYSWERSNVEDFWNDTVVSGENEYFIGNFVVYEDGDFYGIVDGQQRMTTLTLLLCALRNTYQREGFGKLAAGVHLLIERPNMESELLYVLQTKSSYPYLQEHIQKFPGPPEVLPQIGHEEEYLRGAFQYFEEQLTTIVTGISKLGSLSSDAKQERIQLELTRVPNKVTGLKLILTSLTSDDDAYTIFET